MVYVNSKKFACESCIKGHRSSSCHHTDRPLFEIKKKGRPVSQCTKCRELRQSKKFHSKCTCNHQLEEAPAVQPLASSSTSKTRRFIPIVPALPNGLRDVLAASTSPMQASDVRQRVDSLLNPCDCKSLWKCKCRDRTTTGPHGSNHQTSEHMHDLDALASAAAVMSCCTPVLSTNTAESAQLLSPSQDASSPRRSHPARMRSRPGSPPTHISHKRHKRNSLSVNNVPGPDLAPLLYMSSEPSFAIPPPMPEFPLMPPMSEIRSLAGSGCTCGVKCACPGCVEHSNSTHDDHNRRECGEGCGVCVDPSLGMALPDLNGTSQGSEGSLNFLDRFFARAAALPPPPVHRKMSSYHLDPMDTTIFPSSGSQIFVFGAVQLPKLECCGGQCNCPSGQCTCRTSCAGCCTDALDKNIVETEVTEAAFLGRPSAVEPRGSCCT
ncbi:hypothetical protein BDN70DRAFT_879614 [Pholiota conissans]|uniref:Copper-fist domain-containing protein n=1 Tax=Pholiota conissans TaxID=109636 RepID=A0A9P6CZV9_9AGAR|nr:hypothetical protein BDN70DRAFT_879614 [Pholiota conissans]